MSWDDGRALCIDDPDPFYVVDLSGSSPDQQVSFNHMRADLARSICARCPVFDDCRLECDAYEEPKPFAEWHGIWAGETPTQRRTRRRWAARGALVDA